MNTLENLNRFCKTPWPSLETCLEYYRQNMPSRCPDYIEEEIGPVFLGDRSLNKAKELLTGKFEFQAGKVEMNNSYDWLAAPDGDLEWNCSLSRHHHLVVLADAYTQTGREEFASAAISQMLDFIENCHRPYYAASKSYFEIKGSGWRVLEVGFRVGETWPTALKSLIKSPHMTTDAWGKILLSLYDQADYLSLYISHRGNHAIMEYADLVAFSIIFPEFKGTDEWTINAISSALDRREKEFFNDGYTREMSGGYRWTMVKGYLMMYRVAKQNDRTELFPTDFEEWLKFVCIAEIGHLKPDLTVPVTNETTPTISRKNQLELIQHTFDIPEIKYILTEGKTGTPPAFTSYHYKNANVGILRSDFSPQALYLSADFGPLGEAHQTGDKLAIDLCAFGQNFLAGCGRWRYTSSPDSSWMNKAAYFKSSKAFNTVSPVGYSQKLVGATGTMQTNQPVEIIDAVFDGGYANDEKELNLTHRREIFFIEKRFWIIRDTITGQHSSDIELENLWHFLPKHTVKCHPKAPNTFITNNPDANLIIQSINPEVCSNIYLGQESPFHGWHCPYYAQTVPAAEIAFRQIHKGKTVFETLLFPTKGPVEKLPECIKSSNGYNVRMGNQIWQI